MSFVLKILGSGSATPLKGRHQSAQLVSVNQSHYLIDCGEGTQYRLIEEKANWNKIEAIFISHLHGDHYLGLVGLVSTMGLLGRKKPLKVFAPVGLMEIVVTQFRVSQSVLEFHLEILELEGNTKSIVYEDENAVVSAFPLVHGIATYGFWVEEKPRERKLIKEKIKYLSIEEMVKLKNGLDILEDSGRMKFSLEEYTYPPVKCQSFAYCSDTLYSEQVIDAVRGVDILYHEATYLEEHRDKATRNFHTTAKEAATVAKEANVGKLLIGHLSSRYEDFEAHLVEARKEFPNTVPATEGKVFTLS